MCVIRYVLLFGYRDRYADSPPQFADIGRWCGFFMSLRGVALDLVLATIGLLYERAVAPRPAQHHSADHWGREYQGQHRTENCVQKMSLRGKIKT